MQPESTLTAGWRHDPARMRPRRDGPYRAIGEAETDHPRSYLRSPLADGAQAVLLPGMT
jgi:hypothetical protein